MSGFEVFATSRHDGSLAELFEFSYGVDPVQTILITSADHDITIGADTYISMKIERSDITDDGNPDDDDGLTLKLPFNNAIADLYRGAPLDLPMTLRIRMVHVDDLAQQLRYVWSGRLVDVSWLYPECELSAERRSTALRRTGLTLRFARQCRHVHYGRWCWLDRSDWVSHATVEVIDGNTITLSFDSHGPNVPTEEDPENPGTYLLALPDGWFLGGMLELNGLIRYVIAQDEPTGTGDVVLTLSRPLPSLIVTGTVDLFPGCDRSFQICKLWYQNNINYGGWDYSPAKGPFERSLV